MRYLVTLSLSTMLVIFTSCTNELPEKSPNIIFIMSDDHAQKAISSYDQSLIQTPNIDRLAKEGVRFTNSFVTNSICAPSRATILTGKYSHLNGLRDNRDRFDGSQLTFPKLLREKGYQTAMIGKWHLKTQPTGFDYWNILIGQGPYYNPRMVEMEDTLDLTGYTTRIITDRALDYLGRIDETQPFCLFVQHKAPHRNWMPDLQDLGAIDPADIPVPDNYFDDYTGRRAASEQDMRVADMWLSHDLKLTPEYYEKETGTGGQSRYDAETGYLRMLDRLTVEQRTVWDAYYDSVARAFQAAGLEGKELDLWKYRRYLEDYLGSIIAVDRSVGTLLDYLDENGLTENTLVIYTSDQGFYLGEHGWYDKRFMYEESMRTPLLARYPGKIEAGTTIDRLVLNLDAGPTILDFAGVPIPDVFQGMSWKKLINDPDGEWRKSVYYHYYEYPHGWHEVKRHYGIRTETHKLIHFYHDIDQWELYDLEKDPDEMNNIIDEESSLSIRQKLLNDLQRLQVQFADTMIQTL